MYGYGFDGCFDPCGYGAGAPVAGVGYGAPVGVGYCSPVAGVGYGPGKGFALIVVLFILLIIVGASKFGVY
ncbi:YjcZ family sporulation protein [Halalkalibacterium halodurans]|nr:YjcZ family sporulation protein [Halalkalibacterium halodurans]TES56031.1 YjcZ family sporulation protein [Halalkalibacterium halodurans]